jgi:hypothetical protein
MTAKRKGWEREHAAMSDFDQKLAAALHDVPMPDGLLDRLLVGLQTSANAPVFDEESDKAMVRQRVPQRWGRRLSVAALVSAAALFLAIWLGTQPREDVSPQSVLDEAIWAFDAESSAKGYLWAEKSPPAAYPFSQSVVLRRGMRWRALDGTAFGGREGVAYDFPSDDGGRASLYVLTVDLTTLEAFDIAPEMCPFTTAGCCASPWQENGLLYVLVVQGDVNAYRNHLRISSSPVAQDIQRRLPVLAFVGTF